jgi:DNA-binding XRE family transcriptional regulator
MEGGTMSNTAQRSDLDDFFDEALTTDEDWEEFNRTAALVNFGDALAAMRERRGMTQKQLADASGIGRTVIARIEGGNHAPTLITETKLARALNARLEVPPNGQVRFVPLSKAKTATKKARKAASM